MDPLTDVIALLRPGNAISKPITGRGQWGVRYAAANAPGCTIIFEGECWLSCHGGDAFRAQRGDFILLPSSPSFTLSSHPGVPCEHRDPVDVPVRHGIAEGPPDFVSLGVTFSIEQTNAPLLLALLPQVIHIPASEGRSLRLGSIIDLIMQECAGEESGKAMVLQRLLEILLIEALRWRGITTADIQSGLLSGMRDPALSRALRAIHANVRAPWTVANLAKEAGLSRSTFAARFGEVLGCSPIEYLSRWRMALAKDALIGGSKTLDRIANDIGYESTSAFSTAFRKRLGCPPGKFARNGGAAQTSCQESPHLITPSRFEQKGALQGVRRSPA